MPHCPFCHAWLERADDRRCADCGRTLVGTASISAEELGRRTRRSTRLVDRAIFLGFGQLATVTLFNVFASGPLTDALAQALALASCLVMWRYMRSRYRAALVFALPQILLWGVRIFPLFAALMIPATLCTGLLLAMYRDSLRNTLE